MLRQTVAKPKKISDNLLAILVIVGALLVFFFGKMLAAKLDFAFGNIILYVLATVFCCILVLGRLLSYRYATDGTEFYVDRISGRREKTIECVGRKEMTALLAPGTYQKEAGTVTSKCTVLGRDTAYALCYTRNGRKYRLLIHPNEQMLEAVNNMIEKNRRA